MPEITGLRALRYSIQRFGQDFSNLIAPPYDVLDEADKAALLRRSEYNIVAVDLPHVPPKTAGPDEVYAEAARRLDTWRSSGVVIREEQPALYVYHQRYTWNGKPFTRRKFFARMRLEAFGTGTVFPHEQTFGGPKEDRFKLMQATQCQLSAVFGLYSDPANAVSELLDPRDRAPDITATMEDVENRIWIVTDPQVIDAVGSLMRDRPVYIADGHHRYGTALNYREWLTAKHGPLPLDHDANFVLVGFCAMEDPGAVILPTHRVLADVGGATPADVLAALGQGLELTPAPGLDPEAAVASDAPHDLAIYVASEDKLYTARFTQRDVLDTLASDRSKPWRQLDLAYLHRYLIDELLTKGPLKGREPGIHYIKAADDAIQDAKATGGIALLTKPCSMAELKAVSDAGDLMPQKSTYFYPKLATGFVINPLA